MKRIFFKTISFIAIITLWSLINTGCQSKPGDADIKAAIEAKFKNDPMTANTTIDVKDGIVTISGQCMNDSNKNYCTRIAETIPNVKSVVNNCTVAEISDEVLNNKIGKIAVDYPYIKIGAMNGIV